MEIAELREEMKMLRYDIVGTEDDDTTSMFTMPMRYTSKLLMAVSGMQRRRVTCYEYARAASRR